MKVFTKANKKHQYSIFKKWKWNLSSLLKVVLKTANVVKSTIFTYLVRKFCRKLKSGSSVIVVLKCDFA